MHNAYVQQLHAANGMLEHYNKETLPKLLEVSVVCFNFNSDLYLKFFEL